MDCKRKDSFKKKKNKNRGTIGNSFARTPEERPQQHSSEGKKETRRETRANKKEATGNAQREREKRASETVGQ